MREAIPTEQGSEQFQEGLITVLVAGFLALSLAIVTEALLTLWGTLRGDTEWHRHWVDQRLAASSEWLAGVPLFGPLAAWLGGLKEVLPSQGAMRNVLIFGLALFPWTLVPARRIGPTLIARYDSGLLRPPATGDRGLPGKGPTGDAQADACQRLHAWCFAGAGTGRSPFWRPWVMPNVPQRFSIAVLTGPNGIGKSHLADALGRELDGTLQLKSCTSRASAIRLRLRVKYDNCRWWRPRQASDPWDSGYLLDGPVANARLAMFSPRRATLIVADAWPQQSLVVAIEALNARRSAFHHPVRLLILNAVVPDSLEMRWDADRAVWISDLQGLGDVPAINLPKARFAPSQFRRTVGPFSMREIWRRNRRVHVGLADEQHDL